MITLCLLLLGVIIFGILIAIGAVALALLPVLIFIISDIVIVSILVRVFANKKDRKELVEK